jgi:hypothetical protein
LINLGIKAAMARKPKVEFEGTLYDVIAPGNHQREIFRDQTDGVTNMLRKSNIQIALG